MAKTPDAIQVGNDYILDHLTLAIVGAKSSNSKFPDPNAPRLPRLFLAFGVATAPKLRAINKPEFHDQVQPGSGHSNRANRANLQPANVQLSTNVEEEPNFAQQALNLRAHLGLKTKWTGLLKKP